MAFKLDHRNVEAELLVRRDPTFLGERDVLHELVTAVQAAETSETSEAYVDVDARLLARYAARQRGNPATEGSNSPLR